MPKLLSFEIENYRSFFKAQHISFKNGNSRNINALYGPNSTGKSNVVLALAAMNLCVLNSAEATWKLPYEPFLLREESRFKPTRFSVSFESSGKTLFYEFSFNQKSIVSEILQEKSPNSNKRKTIFLRSENTVLNSTAAKNGFGKRLAQKTRPETLIITKAREDNNAYSNLVFDFFTSLILVTDSLQENNNAPLYIEMLRNNHALKTKTIELLRKCDFAIRDIKIESIPIPPEVLDAMPLPPEIRKEFEAKGGTAFKTVHAVRDEERTVTGEVDFDFWTQESVGTRKFFEVIVPIITALEEGRTIVIDEFSSYLHPTLVSSILSMFRRQKEFNAHLMIITHNISLMRNDLTRDEIFLVEKNLAEETRITPLSESGARNNDSLEKRYSAGFYGGIPLIKR